MATKKRTRKNKLKRDIENRRDRMRQRARFVLICGGFVLLMGVLSVSLVFAYDFFTQTAHFEAKAIQITGNIRLTTAEILKLSKVHKGMNILSLKLGLTRKRLLSHPWVAEATVQREIPSSVHIRITEQQPVAIVHVGKPFLMNEKGDLFKGQDELDPDHLPEITGLAVDDFREDTGDPSRSKAAVMAVLAKITASQTPFPENSVRKIHADRDLGITITALEPEKEFKLGFGDYEFKFKRIARLIQFLESKSYMADFQSIDMTDANRIVVQPAKTDPELS